MMLTPTERMLVEQCRPRDRRCDCTSSRVCTVHALISIIDRLVGRAVEPDAPLLDDRPMMAHVARTLDAFFNDGRDPDEPRQLGFVLMVSPLDGSRNTLCVSNHATRKEVVDMCRLTIEEMEGGTA